MGNNTISGIIGGVTVIMFLLVVCAFFEPFNYKSVYIANPNGVLIENNSIINDTITCSRIEVLKDLENKGLLLTPGEYTSHISSYYSTLVTFLIGLFVLFTVGSIYSIKITSKKEIEDIKNELDNRESKIQDKLKSNIRDSLNELLRDSISFKESVINALYGRIEDELVTVSDKEIIERKLSELEENINLLYETFDELSDRKLSKEEIE
ncbi:hypothetical protein [Parabacteroides chongii]|uniref:hypothetical protein n=1 Tax=Parabacteroides chongii TaxID=2685834 RepID=UPI00240E8142|nr:hypothetical protein [Parabacteroides chongii]WFE84173.1 hypothetical protein P3L47_18855 [Parabacteroides chongii]